MAENWRAKAKELAATVAAAPEAVRVKVEDTLTEAVEEIHADQARVINQSGVEEQLLCMMGEDGIAEAEEWVRKALAECEQEVAEGI